MNENNIVCNTAEVSSILLVSEGFKNSSSSCTQKKLSSSSRIGGGGAFSGALGNAVTVVRGFGSKSHIHELGNP